MNYGLTPFGGAIIAEHYRSAAVGIGKSPDRGAISVDGSISDTELANGDRKQGQSFRFLYSKSLNQMGTNFQLAGYRYATSGYYDLSDAVQSATAGATAFMPTITGIRTICSRASLGATTRNVPDTLRATATNANASSCRSASSCGRAPACTPT